MHDTYLLQKLFEVKKLQMEKIYFISSYPPLVCGIGSYTYYIVSQLPEEVASVISFSLDISKFRKENQVVKNNVLYVLDYDNLYIPWYFIDTKPRVCWLQHSFGLWEKDNQFIELIKELTARGEIVIVSFHTLHFETNETEYGLKKREFMLIKGLIEYVHTITVFTKGAYQATSAAFKKYTDKIVLLRHGVKEEIKINKFLARKKLFSYLQNFGSVNLDLLLSDKTILIGNYGFVAQKKNPVAIFTLRELLQRLLPQRNIVAIYAGVVRNPQEKESLFFSEELKDYHDGETCLFFNVYIPEELLRYAFCALDLCIFWYTDATQSGRLTYAQGAGILSAGKNIEGIGETLLLTGMPTADTLEELAQKVAAIFEAPKSLIEELKTKQRIYAKQFSYKKQAHKHLLLSQSILKNKTPLLRLDLDYDNLC